MLKQTKQKFKNGYWKARPKKLKIMSDRASSPNLIESGLNGLKSLIGGGRDNYPLISGTNGKHQVQVILKSFSVWSHSRVSVYSLQRSNLSVMLMSLLRRSSEEINDKIRSIPAPCIIVNCLLYFFSFLCSP